MAGFRFQLLSLGLSGLLFCTFALLTSAALNTIALAAEGSGERTLNEVVIHNTFGNEDEAQLKVVDEQCTVVDQQHCDQGTRLEDNPDKASDHEFQKGKIDSNNNYEELYKIISLEIRETRKLIEMQQAKVGILEKLRKQIVSGITLTFEDKKLLDEIEKDMQLSLRLKTQHHAEVYQERNDFTDHFTVQYSIDDDLVVWVDMLPIPFRSTIGKKAKLEGYKDSALISCVGFSNGTIAFIDQHNQSNIAFYETGHMSSLVRLWSVPAISPFLVSLAEDGETRVHNISAYFHNTRLVGKLEKPSNSADNTITIVASLEAVIKNDPDPGKVTAMAIMMIRRTDLIIYGHESGRIRIFDRSGTPISGGVLELEKPITALTTNGANLAIGQGSDVVFAKIAPKANVQRILTNKCLGEFGKRIIDIEYDSLLSTVVYAATNTGEVLVFHQRKRIPTSNGKKSTIGCKIVHKINPNVDLSGKMDEISPTTIACLRGYIVTMTHGKLSIYNTTRISFIAPELVGSRMFPAIATPPIIQDVLPYIKAIPQGTGRAADFSLVVGNRGNVKELGFRFCIYESILAYQPEETSNANFGWFRGPLMMVAMVLFAVWQITNKKRGKGTSHGSASNLFDSMGGGMRDFSRGDFGTFGTGDFRNRPIRGNTMSAEQMFRYRGVQGSHNRDRRFGKSRAMGDFNRGDIDIDFMGRSKPKLDPTQFVVKGEEE